MKHFKIGTLTTIALLAISVTIIARENKFRKAAGTCNQGIDMVAGTTYFTNSSCSGTTATISTCDPNLLNKFISSPTLQRVSTFDCDGGSDAFCCVEVSTQACPLPPGGNKSRVTKVICKSN